jgi:nucleoside-diphosphate-sugar epimerase
VPFVRANPPLGANVNVTGTVNVFEGVLAARDQIRGLVYASSAGVLGPPDLYPDGVARDDSAQAPATLYGVFKQANEGTARIYAAEHGLWSVGLRPWVIYGLGRDQGMTSGVTVAMLAAAAGVPYRITYGGESLFQYAADVAARFIAAARAGLAGAAVFNVGGTTASVDDVIEAIKRAAPDMAHPITHDPAPLPVVARADSSALERSVSVPPYLSLEEGVERTVRAFRRLLEEGRIAPPV